jgi:hypothetical protein
MLGIVDINKLNKGNVTQIFTAIEATTTSAKIKCVGYNAILIDAEFSGAANWTFKVQGSLTENGTYKDCYELANTGSMAAMSYQTNASKVFLFKGIPDWVKIVATEDVDGQTVTVKVQPLNV